MGYLHFEVDAIRQPQYPGAPCGDEYTILHQQRATVVALANGLGRGPQANISANLYLSWIMTLLKNGYSLRESFSSVLKVLSSNRASGQPFAALTLIRCAVDGQTTLLSHSSLAPIYISSKNEAVVLEGKRTSLSGAYIREASIMLGPEDGLLMCLKDVTQAQIGQQMNMETGEEGLMNYVNEIQRLKQQKSGVPAQLLASACEVWGRQNSDDMTVVLVAARKGAQLNILTGPPLDKKNDLDLVNDFWQARGNKVVSGASTAQMISRLLGIPLAMRTHCQTAITPPHYEMAGTDLMTEGAVTLNQVHNLLRLDSALVDKVEGPAGDLCRQLLTADCIHFFVGRAQNKAQDDVTFKQLGILPRRTIVPMLQDVLEKQGKRVIVSWY